MCHDALMVCLEEPGIFFLLGKFPEPPIDNVKLSYDVRLVPMRYRFPVNSVIIGCTRHIDAFRRLVVYQQIESHVLQLREILCPERHLLFRMGTVRILPASQTQLVKRITSQSPSR